LALKGLTNNVYFILTIEMNKPNGISVCIKTLECPSLVGSNTMDEQRCTLIASGKSTISECGEAIKRNQRKRIFKP